MFRVRCCFKYHSNLLFLGRKRETERASNCHPCMNTKLLTLDFPSDDKARWCMLWLCEDKRGEDGTEDEDPLLLEALTLLDFDGEDRLEELVPSEPLRPLEPRLELNAFETLLPTAVLGIVPWWLFARWDDVVRRELVGFDGGDDDDDGAEDWWLLWFCWAWSFPWWLLDESQRNKDWVALRRKCCMRSNPNRATK